MIHIGPLLCCLGLLALGCEASSDADNSPDSGHFDAAVGGSDASRITDSGAQRPDGGAASDGGAVADMGVQPWRARRVFGPEDGLEGPDGLFPAGDGTVLVANEVAGNVLRVDVVAGTVEIEAEGGGLSHPEEVTLGPDGALWISDDSARAVFKVGENGVERVVGSAEGLRSPEGIAVDAQGVLYIGDEATQELLRLRPGQALEVIADSEDGVFAPEGLAVDARGTVYATDDRRGGVIAYDANGPRVFLTPEQLRLPEAVAVGPRGDLWFTDNGAGVPTIQRFTHDGQHRETIAMPVAANTLAGLCVLDANTLVVSVFKSRETHEIWVVER